MSSTAYRLIGFVVWRALKWYLRELLPSRRRIVLSLRPSSGAVTPARCCAAGSGATRALPTRP